MEAGALGAPADLGEVAPISASPPGQSNSLISSPNFKRPILSW
jgi:hypothetical protein